MKYLYVNCSPKLSKSNSYNILKKISEDEILNLYIEENILNKIENTDTLVLSMPLYIDSPPYKVIELFETLKRKNIKRKNIYIITNCGFLEPKQNDISDEIVKNFCLENNWNYKGSFKIGSGEIIGKYNKNKIYRILSNDFIKKANKFKENILKNNYVELSTTIKPMTQNLFIKFANHSFKRKIDSK